MSPAPHVDPDPVLEPLETVVSRGFARHDVFRDWVRLMLHALQRDDEAYLDVLDDYDRGHDHDRDREEGERTADLFAAAFGELQVAMSETGADVLGEAYEAFGMGSDAFGQHFTPHTVARAAVEIQATVEDDPDPPVTICDPACGSGRLLVLAARRHDVATFCVGQDKDPLCARMAALNFCFFNMDGMVVHGDSLLADKRAAWATEHTAMGGVVSEVPTDSIAYPEAAFEPPAAEADAGAGAEAEAEAEGAADLDADAAAAAADRLRVEAGGTGVEQSDLGRWSP